MNYNKDKTKAVLLISTLIVLALVSYYFILSNYHKQEQAKIKIPNITDITSINLQTLKQEKTITNKVEITKIINIINTSKQTKKQSINDYPTNATKIITITFISKEKNTTIYIYNQNDKYYVEQPYQNINIITENNYNLIKRLI